MDWSTPALFKLPKEWLRFTRSTWWVCLERVLARFVTDRSSCRWVCLTHCAHRASKPTVLAARKSICLKPKMSILTGHTSVLPSLTFSWCTIQWLWYCRPRSTTTNRRSLDSMLQASEAPSTLNHPRAILSILMTQCKHLNWRHYWTKCLSKIQRKLQKPPQRSSQEPRMRMPSYQQKARDPKQARAVRKTTSARTRSEQKRLF